MTRWHSAFRFSSIRRRSAHGARVGSGHTCGHYGRSVVAGVKVAGLNRKRTTRVPPLSSQFVDSVQFDTAELSIGVVSARSENVAVGEQSRGMVGAYDLHAARRRPG